MSLTIRKTRTLSVTEIQISPEEQELLTQLALDPRYTALLNVMERSCVALDSALINAPVGEPESILGGHAVSKAAWLFFTYVQKQVQNAYNNRTGEGAEEARPSLEDMLQGVEG